jgi:integrin beta 8
MVSKFSLLFALILLFPWLYSFGQIKIGDNVSTIDGTSILELESSSKVLVLTRLTNVEMLDLNPLAGGMVYNTDTGCIHSYNGFNWISLCEGGSNNFSFVDNNDGTFTINYSDGTSFTSSNLTGPQGDTGPIGADGNGIASTANNGDGTFTLTFDDGTTFTSSDLTGPAGTDGTGAGAEQEQIVVLANDGQRQFTTPAPIDDRDKIQVYRNGVRIAFTTLGPNTIELESDITCYQNDTIRIVQIL